MSVVLYHHPGSLCSQKVRLALAEKGVTYEAKTIDIGPSAENLEPWYVKLNPRGVVPTLVHDGQPVTDSARIVRYIDDHFPGPELHATTEGGKELEVFWIDAADKIPLREISYGALRGPLGWLLRRSDRVRLKRVRFHRERNPELAPLYDAKIADIERWFSTVRDPEQVKGLLRDLGALLDRLDAHLQGHEVMNGERFGVADILWTVVLARVIQLGFREMVESRPAVRAYYHRMRERPAFAEARVWERTPWREILKSLLTRKRSS